MEQLTCCKGCGANEWKQKHGYIECEYCGTTERNYATAYEMDTDGYEKLGLSACSGIIPTYRFKHIVGTGYRGY